MRKTLKEIAELIEGEVAGDSSIIITGISGIREAQAGDITFLANPKYASLLGQTAASAVIVSKDTEAPAAKSVIRTTNPSLAFTKVMSLIAPDESKYYKGVHNTAIIGKNVLLGKEVSIGPYVVLEDNVEVGDKSIIYPGTFIGHDSKIGKGTLIYANVSIRERIIIGSRVIIHSGTVIGSDGFGFVTVEGKHHKIPQVGIVEVQDDVEVGANVTIDRARFEKTVIGRGTKIDNLVQIAHNVIIGDDCLLSGQSGVAGSTVIGKNVIIAGQAGVIGHITVGDNVIVTAQTGVSKPVSSDSIVSGSPAYPHMETQKIRACTHRLPKLFDLVSELKIRIEDLEKKLKDKK
ncbi:MAG: UDP-3-O-(3-hydroxymyristoyl)glucosamine N-acyltransferase [Candidatus Omnitrophica bacterium]|nr:UDP-3-O-(3-hydroxymyristoyl)glucosamine N-acyltransferase [Candidatus Omnitrophota bacterium]